MSKDNKLFKDNFFDPYDYESYRTYESCLMRKIIKTPFIWYRERASDVLDLVHTDVCSPMSTQARGGYSYCWICTVEANYWLTHYVILELLFILIIFYLSIKDFFFSIMFMCPWFILKINKDDFCIFLMLRFYDFMHAKILKWVCSKNLKNLD